jgi:pilin isopeptide linkage protein
MRNMNPNKILKRVASLGMALLLVVGVTAPVQAVYLPSGVVSNQSADNVKVTLTAELKLEGDETADKEEFSFVLVPDDEAYPMPENATMKIKGAGEIQFDEITYAKRGKYTYTLYQEEGTNQQYTYDKTKYEIKVTVDRSYSMYYAFYSCHKVEDQDVPQSTAKVDEMLFVNEYEAPDVPSTPTEPTTPSEPSPEPSEEPSPEPSEEPSPEPSEEPSPEPSEEPSPEPSEEPSPEPSEEPSPEPSEEPSPEPSEEPSPEPSEVVEPSPEPSEEVSPSPSAVTETTPKPSSGTGSSVTPGTTPKTGDETDNSLWITMICVAAAGLVAGMCYLLVPRKRRHR